MMSITEQYPLIFCPISQSLPVVCLWYVLQQQMLIVKQGENIQDPCCKGRETQVLKVINSGAICAICLPLCYPVFLTNHPHSQNTFSPLEEALYQWAVNSCDFFSQSLATMTLHSVYVNLPILNNSYKNNHMLIFCFCFGCFALYTHTGTHT